MAALLNPLTDQAYVTAKRSFYPTTRGSVPQYSQLRAADVVSCLPAQDVGCAWGVDILFIRDVFELQFARAAQQPTISLRPGQPFVFATGATLAPVDVPPEASESTEVRWLRENRQLLEYRRGEWLLIYGDGLVAHSTDFGEIRAAIAERGIRSPFIYYVPTNEESEFILF